ncbi:MAG: AAA family ATPase [Myxococcota bacterium]
MLRRVHIENVKVLDDVVMELPDDPSKRWHVVLGDNGVGKTTLIRAIALVFTDGQSGSLRLDLASWQGAREDVGPSRDPAFNPRLAARWRSSAHVTPEPDARFLELLSGGVTAHRHSPKRVFCASYGPYRRFTGGRDYSEMERAYPLAARHLSAFGEDAALSSALTWISDLHVKELEGRRDGGLLAGLTRFVNESGLPHGVRLLRVMSDLILFADAEGKELPIQQLADGYRSVLSMTFELIRQMSLHFGEADMFTEVDGRWVVAHEGIVLIDEVDAHLHPSWQAKIGEWFLSAFPRVTFLVTTHSPLVCRAAVDGTIWRLRSPGESGDQLVQITGEQLDRILYGNLHQALESEAFQLPGVARSTKGREKQKRLAELNRKQRRSLLSAEEELEYASLQTLFPADEQAR